MALYILGGSPCSGKSTIAEMLRDRHNMTYFKVDDFLDKYTESGARKGLPFLTKAAQMTPDEIWLRPPREQCDEELGIYREMREFIQADIYALKNADTIAEGAAFLPELAAEYGIDARHYVCITPSRDFQYDNYRRRPWVPLVLEGCSDKAQAFENWMQRDALFALDVQAQAERHGYTSIITDGTRSAEDMLRQVERIFGFE